MSAAALLAALQAGPVYHADRDDSPESRVALLAPVAEAIHATAKTAEEASALVVLARSESHLARYVLEGRCHEGPVGARCDGGLARGAWQLWGWCKATTVTGEAACALSLYRHGLATCGRGATGRRRVALAFQLYATGHCGAPSAESLRRSAEWARVVGKLVTP